MCSFSPDTFDMLCSGLLIMNPKTIVKCKKQAQILCRSYSESNRNRQSHTETYGVKQSNKVSYRVIQSHTELYSVIQSHTELYRVCEFVSEFLIHRVAHTTKNNFGGI